VGKLYVKISLEKSQHKWENNIEMDLKNWEERASTACM